MLQEKAAKLHEQLHGSTFHIKLAKEAMKKVRQAEAEVQVKEAAEAEAIRAGNFCLCLRTLKGCKIVDVQRITLSHVSDLSTHRSAVPAESLQQCNCTPRDWCYVVGAESRRLMLDLEDKTTQTDPLSKPGSPATPRRPMPTARNIVRQAPVPRPVQQPIIKREPRPVVQPRPPPNVHVATTAGAEVTEGLPPARTGLPSARPTLPPKRQQQNLMREIHVPTSLLKRRGLGSEAGSSAPSPVPDDVSPVDNGAQTTALPSATAEALPSDTAETLPSATPEATVSTGVAARAPAAAVTVGAVQSLPPANTRPVTPQLGIMAAGGHAATASASKLPIGAVRSHGSPRVGSTSTMDARLGGAPPAVAVGGDAAGLSMLGHSKHEPTGSPPKGVKQQATAAVSQSTARAEASKAAGLPVSQAVSTIQAKLPDRVVMPTPETQEADASAEGVNMRPVSAMTAEPDAVSTPGMSRLQTPQEAAALTSDLASSSLDLPELVLVEAAESTNAAPEAQDRPASSSSSSQASVSRPSTADAAGLLDLSQHISEDPQANVLQVTRATAGRIHRHRAHPRPQSPLQTQISALHGSAPGAQGRADQAPAQAASTTAKAAQRAQHGSKAQKTGKVPPLNMSVMRALKQQVSGLVPLDSRGGSKTARTVLQQTAPASQRALSSRFPPGGTMPGKAESSTQLTPLASNALHSRSLPEVTPMQTSRGVVLQSLSHFQSQTVPQSQTMLPGLMSAATPRQTLPLDATVQLIGDIYDSKAVADLAALRQHTPCRPMHEFAQQYLQRRYGTGVGGSWQGSWQQLEAAVQTHGGDARVAAFGVTCGLLQRVEETGGATSAQVGYMVTAACAIC